MRFLLTFPPGSDTRTLFTFYQKSVLSHHPDENQKVFIFRIRHQFYTNRRRVNLAVNIRERDITQPVHQHKKSPPSSYLPDFIYIWRIFVNKLVSHIFNIYNFVETLGFRNI